MTHLGHSCLLVEMADRRILLDPGNFSAGFEDLRDLDAILVTHMHADHFDPDRVSDLIRANPNVQVHADPMTAQKLRVEGLDVEENDQGDVVKVGDVKVHAIGDLHAFNHEAMPRIPNTGWVLRAPGELSLFHPGDAYDGEPGKVDVLAHPLNAPWAASRDSVGFVGRIGAKKVVPIHDALLSDRGRKMYATHLESFSGVEGLEVEHLGDRESATF